MSKLRDMLKRVTVTHVLLLAVAIFLCLIWLEMRSVNETLRVISCDMPDLPCQKHY